MESKSAYDGKLIGVVHGEVNETDTRLFYFGSEGRRLIHPQMLCKDPPPFARQALHRLPRNIRDVVQDGRLCVYWLINSKGGVAMVSDRIQLGMEGVRERDGTIESYGFDTFNSAAARIWYDADMRFCMTDSVGVWHVREGDHQDQSLPNELRKFILEKRQQDMLQIIELINSVRDSELRESMFQMAYMDPTNRMTVGLPGIGYGIAGIAQILTTNKTDLFQLFMNRSGWRPKAKWAYLLDPIGRFAVKTLGMKVGHLEVENS